MNEYTPWAPGKANPYAKKTANFTDQMFLEKNNPKLAGQLKAEAARLDMEAQRQERTLTAWEFNQLTADQKAAFGRKNGIVEG